jgi:hypothetical protein
MSALDRFTSFAESVTNQPSCRRHLHLTQTLVAAGRPKGIRAADGAVAASCRAK